MKILIDTDEKTIKYYEVEYLQDFTDFPKFPEELKEYRKSLDLTLSCKKKQIITDIANKQINSN
jgi:hypothetical protein